jgi:hypothetical protein
MMPCQMGENDGRGKIEATNRHYRSEDPLKITPSLMFFLSAMLLLASEADERVTARCR